MKLQESPRLQSQSDLSDTSMRRTFIVRVAVVSLIIIVILAASGALINMLSAHPSQGGSTSNVVHASNTQTTVLQLHDGGILLIPAGAMTEGATVTATYTNPPKDNQTDQAPIGPQVHFSVEPEHAIHQPLFLEFPLSKEVFPAAARYGAYSVATFDASRHVWVDVASTYDPITNMLVTRISHFSWWTTVKQAAHYAVIIAKCIPSSVGDGVTSFSWSAAVRAFLTCLVKAGVSDLSSSLADRFLRSMMPKTCWSALAVDGLLGSPASVLKGIFTEPACTGHAGETLPPPTVTAVSPSSGPTTGGNSITITGSLFQLANQVLIGGTSASFSIAINSGNSITATVPAHTAGTVDVRVVTGGGTSGISSADRYTYIAQVSQPPHSPTSIPEPPRNPSPGSLPPNSETAGGVAHTWTNYTNAGGTEGPSVAKYQTVQMSCRITGFRVADGNTWWYRIAQSPWNNQYYVSADAFYNNGQTSGSLSGTPWVDPNVPLCSEPASPPTPTPIPPRPQPTPTPIPPRPQPTPTPAPPAPQTWPETAGGVAHTWTNYTNAGGTEGPSVAAYQTVQIACKLTGFRVADGNTWWYRIAQSPWNNQYYVSADAFYNNGQTSGSLSGTPFVDPNVPNC